MGLGAGRKGIFLTGSVAGMRRLLLPIILLAIAIAVGVGSYLFLIVLQRPRLENIVTAKTDIPSGTVVEKAMLGSIEWLGKDLPNAFIRVADEKEYLGRITAIDIAVGTPIVKGSFAPPGAQSGLFAKIPGGMRALTVKVDEVSGVAGFIKPGSSVDVLLAARESDEEKGEGAKIILQNVLVLATGQRTTQLAGEDKPKIENTVTLLLSPEGAERLALASRMGTILLTLRSGKDTDIVQTKGAVSRDIWGRGLAETPTLVAKAPDEKKGKQQWVTVELIQGGKREDISFPYDSPGMTESESEPEPESPEEISVEQEG